MIDRDSPLPLYYQLMQSIKADIERSSRQHGDPLPPEREYEERYGLSRTTVRQALNELEREGLVHRIQGKGTFVADPRLEIPLAQMRSFSEEMTERGIEFGTHLVDFQEVVPKPAVAKKIGIAPDETVLRIERVRTIKGKPIALQVLHILSKFGFEAEREYFAAGGSLFSLVESRGIRFAGAQETLQAVAAEERGALLLGVAVKAPLVLIQRIWHLQDSTVLGYGRMLYRGDRYKYSHWLPRQAGIASE